MSLTYRVPGRTTTVTYLGKVEFEQSSAHLPAKSEYGLDTMKLEYIGAMPRLANFLKGLKQGKRYDHEGRRWYLTQWAPDENRIYPTVSLMCVGLAEGVLPAPKGDDSYITQSITVTATVTEDDEEISVTRDINYRCLQTAWHYVTEGRPTAPRIGRTSRQQNPGILSSVIEANGVRYSGANAPGPYVAATQPATIDFVLSLEPEEVFGTPYFNVTETVARMFIAA